MKDLPRIGCIGLGRMGLAIASRYVAAGYEVSGFDSRLERCDAARAVGVEWRAGVTAVVKSSDLIVDCVRGPSDVNAVIDSIDSAHAFSQVFIETTTLSPRDALANASRLSASGMRYLDCPISGGEDGAAAGALTLMIGGSNETLEEIRSSLLPIAKRIFHMGEVGAGSRMKAIVQATFLSHMAAFLEALALGRAAGLPFVTQLSVMEQTTAHHPTLGKRYAQIIAENFSPRYEVRSALKDLGVVAEVAHDACFTTSIVDVCRARYQAASDMGFAEEDLTALLKYVSGPGGFKNRAVLGD